VFWAADTAGVVTAMEVATIPTAAKPNAAIRTESATTGRLTTSISL
jgi:hypothetical protein